MITFSEPEKRGKYLVSMRWGLTDGKSRISYGIFYAQVRLFYGHIQSDRNYKNIVEEICNAPPVYEYIYAYIFKITWTGKIKTV